ncbi:hypothetical protein [Sinisalibacter lacisalsi]|uniref:Uncharacterized protein n=1 Tax=Sinisalibacter lacisalsi TaxID=1526570 RepID=A0ABQ1QQZ3_9RHOB|nr:hypothetical protein [Sinisalibacter lacisalsi]GGD37474.1 hypothetical protein GCM10011358_21560 [Sinisalibacter lacisalsi]
MPTSLAEKARARRRGALAALNARFATDEGVVSIFEGSFPKRQAVPEFRSVRGHPDPRETRPLPVLVLRNRVAA